MECEKSDQDKVHGEKHERHYFSKREDDVNNLMMVLASCVLSWIKQKTYE